METTRQQRELSSSNKEVRLWILTFMISINTDKSTPACDMISQKINGVSGNFHEPSCKKSPKEPSHKEPPMENSNKKHAAIKTMPTTL